MCACNNRECNSPLISGSIKKIATRYAGILAALVAGIYQQNVMAQNFPSSNDKIPAGWTGPVFKLSQDYPATLPQDPLPWQAIDPTREPERYARTVYNYVLEGNIQADWDVRNNKVRRWYHAPWMHYGDTGREFIRGLTRERTSPAPGSAGKGELGPAQTRCFQNWAVGFYNPPGGYQVGKVWAKPDNPDAVLSQFPNGTVIAKLLFTTAPDDELPYLKNAVEWQANVHVFSGVTCPSGALVRRPQTVRLLQVDIAIKDARAAETGWVFATLSYNGNAAGATPWERMQLVGVMWGNDIAKNQQWINKMNGTPQHLGAGGRLNGPVDNPRSSCISCHATAQTPSRSPMIAPSQADAPRWFANYPGNRAFDAGATATDYSLQIAMGIQNLNRSKTPVRSTSSKDPGPALIPAEDIKLMNRAFDSGRDIPLPIIINKALEYPVGR
ncbi:hypothetical protein F2P44_28785 [Massilia sp. CCM 8695]|uniref:Cytochrome c domain-containing protein n=1 Tax=Massilia frigida TaxID=2609281 RepID=A0ABX0NIE1_9BURK|nr:cytochrome P460 family protein [Massilia frigida]NHZ83239.1 hypothetical protein [Massilia frigida]